MHGFNQRQLEQLEEIVKRVIVQVLEEEKRQYPLATLEEVQECTGSIGYCEMENQNGVEVTGRITDDGVKIESIKPKISSHLYNNGRFACCCEVCGGDCGNSEYC